MHLDHPLHHLHSNLHLSEANQQVLTSKRADYLRKFSIRLLKAKDPKVTRFSTAEEKKMVSRIFAPLGHVLETTEAQKGEQRLKEHTGGPRTRGTLTGRFGNSMCQDLLP